MKEYKISHETCDGIDRVDTICANNIKFYEGRLLLYRDSDHIPVMTYAPGRWTKIWPTKEMSDCDIPTDKIYEGI